MELLRRLHNKLLGTQGSVLKVLTILLFLLFLAFFCIAMKNFVQFCAALIKYKFEYKKLLYWLSCILICFSILKVFDLYSDELGFEKLCPNSNPDCELG